jgi:zinc transport system permease protein
MNGFIDLLLDPSLPFMRNAMIAGILSSVVFGIMGSHVVIRRISYLAGAIAHSALGGIGASLYLRAACGVEGLAGEPLVGALAFALLSALAVWLVQGQAKERVDSVIGAIWSIGMGTGVLLLACTPGYVNATSYLFGDVLLVGSWQLWLIAVLDVAVLTVSMTFHNRLQALAFDEEFSVVKGVSARWFSLLLLSLVAISVVLLVSIVGIVLVVALLTLPAASSGRFVSSLRAMMAGATLIGLFTVPTGLYLSYRWDLPAGPIMIRTVSLVYLGSWLLTAKDRKGI